ncbi:MAG: PEP/pyruvate-binding domain-containing protein, partial [Candidatus Thiodiazotropha sp.]
MKPPLLLDCWNDIYRAGSASAGGKGWLLAKLARYGLPVPDTLVIPAEVEQTWLADLKIPSPEAQESDAELERFRQRLLTHPLPTTLIEALHDKLTSRGWQRRALAVRSSATAEDSSSASFAGIHQSCLNLVGAEALAAGIRTVWASRWTPRAIAYRRRFGFAGTPFAMAVVIMPMIPAQASGIAFTWDPLSGRDDRIILHAHWGLGEALVSGEASGDEIVLSENPFDDGLQLLRITPGDKSVMRVPISGGTRKQITPPDIAQTPVLDEPQALRLGELLRDAAIALDFRRPAFDLEWVWDSERFWLVQARPITALKHNTYPALREQPEIWSRGNTCEVTPYPLSVYDWFNSRRLINLMLEQPLASTAYPIHPGIQRAGLFEGRLYLNLSVMQWELHDAFGLPPKTINALIGGHQPEITVPRASLRQRIIRLSRLMGVSRRSRRIRKAAPEILRTAHNTAQQGREAAPPLEDAAILTRLTEQVRQTRQMKSLFYLQTKRVFDLMKDFGTSKSTKIDSIFDSLLVP